MNINFSKFNLSFQKKLVAKANVLKDNKPSPVSIYQLNKYEDMDYFQKLNTSKKYWEDSIFLPYVDDDFQKHNYAKRSKKKFYTIEDRKQNCLGFVEVNNKSKKHQNIVYIETAPFNIENHRYKYVGETLLSFLVKKQNANKHHKQLIVDRAVTDARPFYLKSFFKFTDEEKSLYQMHLPRQNEAKLLDANQKHTQSRIELVG